MDVSSDIILENKNDILYHYDYILNKDKSTYKSTNDETTPLDCVKEMIESIPESFWNKQNLKILDPCCGNGNFHLIIFYKLLQHHTKDNILNNILYFNDVNKERLNNVRKYFNTSGMFNLNITNNDYIDYNDDNNYDLIVANPPYAKFLENGKRAAKNHNLIKDFLEKALTQLKPNGYLLFITPDNWMSFADRNTIISKLTSLQIIHLDIHSSKKYFKKIGSTFTWYLVENCPFYKNINITGIYNKEEYKDSVTSLKRSYIPLFYNQIVYSILSKTIDNTCCNKFKVETSSDLHKYTKRDLIQTTQDDTYKYKLIHTPKQTVYASRPHKYQEGYKVFISTTDKYGVFIDNCGMTQSIAFIRCDNEKEAFKYKEILDHPLYKFINNICRWGNFNNIRILQRFPLINDKNKIYKELNITKEEIELIEYHTQ